MHPLEAHNLFELSAASYAAASAAQLTDDIEQRAGLISAVEHLTAELKRITWEYVEAAELDEARPRIDPLIARSLNPMCDLRDLADAINRATGDELSADAIKLVECNGDVDGWLVMGKATGRYRWHVTVDGRLTSQGEGEQ
ncbi:hypothetical protein CKO42_15510 [Lamprobacter modestohalophilus]|uniref:Uncharacterized protein n=1 Tax=Lamprobacter modestohalophilus TaxID=1064514 RepID=A0A9X0WAB5_9GAMM|nr:hypothetical protein [Lamprobacter modestohalophilus]MBK1619824.1 hypothetical protein [Lamprobacter modestohalophilus]